MNINHNTIWIDSIGNISNNIVVDTAVTVDIAQFNHFSNNRKQRRALQSLEARKLLFASLQKHLQLSYENSRTLNKSEAGKPFLKGNDMPEVSISHSGDWCASAISTTALVGIDIEVIRCRDWESYSKFAFHPEETQWMLSATGKERDIRGLICWCRKEAVVKALGLNLSASLSSIGFSSEGELIMLPSELGNPLDWKVITTTHIDNLVVAVAWRLQPNASC